MAAHFSSMELPSTGSSQKIKIRVFNADNEVFVLAGARLAYQKPTEGDPNFQDDVDFDLKKGDRFFVGGINWGGPAHFRYVVYVDGNQKDDVDWRQSNAAHGLAYMKVYTYS